MEPAPGPARRPFNPEALQPHLAKKKLRAPVVLPQIRRKTVSLARDSFAPVIQAEVGSDVSVNVYSYKVLVPIAQIIRQTDTDFRRVTIATQEDLDLLLTTLVEHFGGITGTVIDPPTIRGVGARDPQQAVATREENEHASFEVYAAPIQESDDYFRALRKELQEALGEGVILIERQQVTLI
jgi:hypothetical protein